MPGPSRKRMKRRESGSSRYITASCYRRMQLMGTPRIRDVFAQALEESRAKWDFKLAAWVAMPEHFHMILWPGPRTDPATPDLAKILHDFKSQLAQRIIARWRQLEAPVLRILIDPRGRARFWQRGGGFDRNIRSEDELAREVAYIHHNPVKRGLVTSAIDWPWSSARWYAGFTDGPVQVHPVWWWRNPRRVSPQTVPLRATTRPVSELSSTSDPPRGG
jgi:putative transposase